MRGPMVSGLVSQLVKNTRWGDLAYLLIDFPPGTGDIQLTLCQELELSGAVIVTTPQTLSYVDVVKGIEMFGDLKVPTLAIIENMSYFKCGSCDEKHQIFGPGHTKSLQEQFGIKTSFQIPLVPDISKFGDSGLPAVLALPDGIEFVDTYTSIAQAVITESVDSETRKRNTPKVFYSAKEGVVKINHPDPKKSKEINPRELRLAC